MRSRLAAIVICAAVGGGAFVAEGTLAGDAAAWTTGPGGACAQSATYVIKGALTSLSTSTVEGVSEHVAKILPHHVCTSVGGHENFLAAGVQVVNGQGKYLFIGAAYWSGIGSGCSSSQETLAVDYNGTWSNHGCLNHGTSYQFSIRYVAADGSEQAWLGSTNEFTIANIFGSGGWDSSSPMNVEYLNMVNHMSGSSNIYGDDSNGDGAWSTNTMETQAWSGDGWGLLSQAHGGVPVNPAGLWPCTGTYSCTVGSPPNLIDARFTETSITGNAQSTDTCGNAAPDQNTGDCPN